MKPSRSNERSPKRATHLCLIFSALVTMGMALVGCVTQSAKPIEQPPFGDRPRIVRIEVCQDRTGFKGERDLPGEATQTLTEKLESAKLFEIVPDAPLTLTCDIERFAEGSALKRWVAPGWGTTEAAIAVMVWEAPEHTILATFRSHSSVSAGGLYTIGADQYILGVAFDDIVKQLQAWVGGTSEGQRQKPQ